MNTRTMVLSTLLAFPMLLVGACGDSDGETSDGETGSAEEVCDAPFSGAITEDTTWTCDKQLEGLVTVENDAVLTVNAGVTIQGRSGRALIVKQGSRLEAIGTPDMPIVFTSSQPEGSRKPADWGGIVLLGSATVNLTAGSGLAEGLEGDFTYGGDDDSYNCGTLQYVRVEFAGFELTVDNELNGITFYACGTGTTVDHVQSHMGKDDGIEMFGGTFDASELIVTGAQDDSLDMDLGFRGTISRVFIHQNPADGNYAFEISNGENVTAEPRTEPIVMNATTVGTGDPGAATKSAGVRWKEGTKGAINNSIITNFYGAQVELTDDETENQANSGGLTMTNNILFGNAVGGGDLYIVSDDSTFDLADWIENQQSGNQEVDPMLTSAVWGEPNIVPMPGSPAAASGIGAVSSDADNFAGEAWTNYTPN